MIEEIRLKNFQTHKDSTLKLHPGVNVIKGRSHSGKSSIIRGLVWALNNDPAGTEFISWFAGKSDETFVSLQFDDGESITRIRSSKFNGYMTNDLELQAMRSDVPEEIKAITKMDDVNIASQDAPFFLLNDSPGEVARKLSEISGLSSIHKVTSSMKEILNRTKTDLKYCRKQMEETNESLEKYEGIEALKPKFTNLKEELARLTQKKEQIAQLEVLLESIKEESERHERLNRVVSKVSSPFLELRKTVARADDLAKRGAQLRSLLNDILWYEEFISSTENLSTLEKRLHEVKEMKNHASTLREKLMDLRSLCHDAGEQKSIASEASERLENLESEREKILSTLEICPVCKREM